MKLYHYCIIFIVVALSLFLISDVKANNSIAIAEEKEKLDHSFDKAIDDAVIHLAETDGMTGLKISKERAVNEFFASLYASLGIMDNPEKQEALKNYVPVISITCEDGYYLYYSDEYTDSDNYIYISKRWTEKNPFYYEDQDFIYGFTLTDIITVYDKNGLIDPTKEQSIFTLDYHDFMINDIYLNFRSNRPDSFLLNEESFYLTRKGCIVSDIEESMSYYCNKHNSIAQQYGITYNFAMPVINNSEWIRSIDNPCMVVMFQGYPFGNDVDNTYNRFAIAGARIKKNDVYYLEQKNWYYLYHKENCPELKKSGIYFLDEPLYSVYDCTKKGAYACPYCCPDGVHAPDYIP